MYEYELLSRQAELWLSDAIATEPINANDMAMIEYDRKCRQFQQKRSTQPQPRRQGKDEKLAWRRGKVEYFTPNCERKFAPPLPPNICFPEITSEDICSLLTVMVMASIQGYVRDNISGAQNVLHSCQPTLSRCLPTGFRDTPRPEIKRHWLPDEWRHLRLVFPAYGDRTVVCASCNFSHAYAKSWGANRIWIIESGKAPLDISCSVIQQQGPSIYEYCSISRA